MNRFIAKYLLPALAAAALSLALASCLNQNRVMLEDDELNYQLMDNTDVEMLNSEIDLDDMDH